MHVSNDILAVIISAGLGLSWWSLRQIMSLKLKIAVLETKLEGYHSDTTHFIKRHK